MFAKKTYRDRTALKGALSNLTEEEQFVLYDAVSEWYSAVADGAQGYHQARLQTDEEQEMYFNTLQTLNKVLRDAGTDRGLR